MPQSNIEPFAPMELPGSPKAFFAPACVKFFLCLLHRHAKQAFKSSLSASCKQLSLGGHTALASIILLLHAGVPSIF